MKRPDYLSKYIFDWAAFDIVLSGKSSLDTEYFIGKVQTREEGASFLKGYGFNPEDPVASAELFGNFQESLQFIRRYFLKEGNPNGLDLKIPNSLYMINDINDLFLMASKSNKIKEDRYWADIVLKIMHTVLHVDKDLRSKYFNVVQTQIFDRFYRFIHRDKDNNLYLGKKDSSYKIPLVNFETKDKKSRDSVIIKLLHKAEHVAEELFDRVGLRFITTTKFDALRVLRFLIEKNIIIPHNNKPSRAVDNLIDMKLFKKKYQSVLKLAIRNDLSEDRFLQALEREAEECIVDKVKINMNEHSAKAYNSIQFTCRQLIKYVNPFFKDFNSVREIAKNEDTDLAKKILSMDISLIAGEVRFFYPYEIQIVDQDSHVNNTIGLASHQEYKKVQLKSAMMRVFHHLLEYKNRN